MQRNGVNDSGGRFLKVRYKKHYWVRIRGSGELNPRTKEGVLRILTTKSGKKKRDMLVRSGGTKKI